VHSPSIQINDLSIDAELYPSFPVSVSLVSIWKPPSLPSDRHCAVIILNKRRNLQSGLGNRVRLALLSKVHQRRN